MSSPCKLLKHVSAIKGGTSKATFEERPTGTKRKLYYFAVASGYQDVYFCLSICALCRSEKTSGISNCVDSQESKA